MISLRLVAMVPTLLLGGLVFMISTSRPKDNCVNNLGGSSRVVSILTLGSRCTGLSARCCFCPILWGLGRGRHFLFGFSDPQSLPTAVWEGGFPRFSSDVRRTASERSSAAARFAAAGSPQGLAFTVLTRYWKWCCFHCTPKENTALAVELLRIVLPYAPMVCLALLGPCFRFAADSPPRRPPAILNVALVVGVLTDQMRPTGQNALCGMGGLVAGVLQVAWSLAVLGDQPFAKPN